MISKNSSVADFIRAAIAAGGAPLNELISAGIRSAVASGAVKGGEQLPSTRWLARELKVSSVTVSTAFRRLLNDGLLKAQVGRGTYVDDGVSKFMQAAAASTAEAATFVLAETPGGRQSQVGRMLAAVDRSTGVNLIGGYGDTRLPPGQSYLKELQRLLRRQPQSALEFARGLGDGVAREAVSRFAVSSLGVDVRPEHVFVGASAHQFLDAIIRTFLEPADVVVCDTPTYYGALDLFAITGLKVVPVPSDEHGLIPQALERALSAHRPKMLYLTGSPSNPEGRVSTLARQQQILTLAQASQLLVVEDSSLFPYFFNQRPIQLKTLDRAGQVIFLCSFSKVLFAGLRVAAAITSPVIARRLGDALLSYWRLGPVLPQRALANYLNSDRLDADLSSARATYRQRRDALLTALQSEANVGACLMPSGGLTLWLELPTGVAGETVCENLVTHGIYALPGEVFTPASGGTSAVRLSYAQSTTDELRHAAPIIGRVVRGAMSSGSP